MFEYFSTNGNSKRVPAEISRKVVEAELINTFHWLPQDIAIIPYEKIKDLLMILDIKEEYRASSRAVVEAKNQAQSAAKGHGKRFREV